MDRALAWAGEQPAQFLVQAHAVSPVHSLRRQARYAVEFVESVSCDMKLQRLLLNMDSS